MLHFDDASVIHGGDGPAGHDHPDMLDLATGGTDARGSHRAEPLAGFYAAITEGVVRHKLVDCAKNLPPPRRSPRVFNGIVTAINLPHLLPRLPMKAILLAILTGYVLFTASAKAGDGKTGIASWYGYPYHGRHAANGEVYDMEKLTAAHRTLPFGTLVHVVNLRNQRTVDVRITDRGPFIDGRIIDLSHAAARVVEMIEPGITPVRLEVIGVPGSVSSEGFAVQVGAFRDRRNAVRLLARMRSRYGSGRIVVREGDPDLWRVLIGSEDSEESARTLALGMRKESELQSVFVARLDR